MKKNLIKKNNCEYSLSIYFKYLFKVGLIKDQKWINFFKLLHELFIPAKRGPSSTIIDNLPFLTEVYFFNPGICLDQFLWIKSHPHLLPGDGSPVPPDRPGLPRLLRSQEEVQR